MNIGQEIIHIIHYYVRGWYIEEIHSDLSLFINDKYLIIETSHVLYNKCFCCTLTTFLNIQTLNPLQ